MIRDGEQIVMGSDDKYTALCRKHHREGRLREEQPEVILKKV